MPKPLSLLLQSANKQSLKAYFPKLNDLTKFANFIKQDLSYYKICIAHCESNIERTSYRKVLAHKPTKILIMESVDEKYKKRKTILFIV